MKRESAENLQTISDNLPKSGISTSWRWAIALIAVLTGWLLVVYGDTVRDMVSVWSTSDTYAHGFIVAPITLYLVWLCRAQLLAMQPTPSLWGAVALIPLGMVWLVARLAGVNVVEQYALVTMLPALVLAVLGPRVTWAIAFPLAFLLLAVPSGEVLLDPLMDLTADFTVGMVRLCGIPVYREGTFFSLPTGDWSVVEACSGLRYLIASFTGGCLFAYLYYQSPWKRVAMMLASLVVPILANWMRAFIVVIIGHLSDMKYAVGADHLLYGWVFFGLVMFLLFWVGSKWSDLEPAKTTAAVPVLPQVRQPSARLLTVLLATVVAGSLWPVYGEHLADRAERAQPIALRPPAVQAWTATDQAMTSWRPFFRGAGQTFSQVYTQSQDSVLLYIAYYHSQRQGAEVVSSNNRLINHKDERWRIMGSALRSEFDGSIRLRETLLKSGEQRLLVWQWFVIDDQRVNNQHLQKLLLARRMLLEGRGDGSAIVIATPYEEDSDKARDTLRRFSHHADASVDAMLSGR